MCHHETFDLFFEDKDRRYISCGHCGLIFVPRDYWLGIAEEKAIYDLHENSPLDQGYRKFISRLTTPLLEKLEPQQKGLDFGSGPGPALPMLLEEHGHQVDRFDLHYQNDPAIFENQYDFICATEVVEHLQAPSTEFSRLFSTLKPGGWLGIMTKLVIDRQAFSNWHYIRDLTHICFYSRRTFEYLAQHFNAKLNLVANDVILLRKM